MIKNVKKPIIAIDIDDVLAKSAQNFVEYSNNHWGTLLTVDDYDENWTKLWQVDNEEAGRRSQEYLGSGILGTYEHNEDAIEVFEKLKEDFKLIVVTSRSTWLKDETTVWIKNKYPYIFTDEDIYFAGIWDKGVCDEAIISDKGDFIMNLGADYIIDDQLKHCIGAARCGIKALLFGDYGWNRLEDLPSRVDRVRNWSEVLEYFQTHGKN